MWRSFTKKIINKFRQRLSKALCIMNQPNLRKNKPPNHLWQSYWVKSSETYNLNFYFVLWVTQYSGKPAAVGRSRVYLFKFMQNYHRTHFLISVELRIGETSALIGALKRNFPPFLGNHDNWGWTNWNPLNFSTIFWKGDFIQIFLLRPKIS